MTSEHNVDATNPFLADLQRTLAETEEHVDALHSDDMNLLRLARVVGPQDNTRIQTILKRVGVTDEEMILWPQFSCITPTILRLIYKRYYHGFGQGASGARELNDRVLRYKHKINQANENIFVQLGEVVVLGATNDRPGWRFVTAAIVGEGRDLLAGEHMGLIDDLLPTGAAGADKLRANRENCNKPHISLLRTRSQNRADQMKRLVSKSEVKGMWAQLVAADTIETFVTAKPPITRVTDDD